MTKVIVLGQQEPKEQPKKIELRRSLNIDFAFENACDNAKDWNYIELICKDYTEGVDLMFAYDDDRNSGCFYLGQFNDGVV